MLELAAEMIGVGKSRKPAATQERKWEKAIVGGLL